jgi:hypothetical protein
VLVDAEAVGGSAKTCERRLHDLQVQDSWLFLMAETASSDSLMHEKCQGVEHSTQLTPGLNLAVTVSLQSGHDFVGMKTELIFPTKINQFV